MGFGRIGSISAQTHRALRAGSQLVLAGALEVDPCKRRHSFRLPCSQDSGIGSLSRQQRLYFLPLPHGQGSLRPGLAIWVLPWQEGQHPLYRALLADAKFHELLLAFDRDLAKAARAAGCARCGGGLHSARFRRKPRGGPAGHGEEHNRRFSFCCASDLCRRRATPPSFRFLGRKVYGPGHELS